MTMRVALIPGTSLSDPTYARALPALARALRARGLQARAFCPRAHRFSDVRRFAPGAVNLHVSGHVSERAWDWARRLRGAPLALTFQDWRHPDMEPPAAARRRAIALARRARLVVALTPGLAASLRKDLPAARRARVIGNAVGPAWFSAPRRRDGPIVAAARLSPYKGIDVLLWAFAGLSRRRPGATLVVFGADHQRGHYQRLARALGLSGRVRFAGRAGATRLRRALARAPFFVSASRRETYGMAVLEAMASGAPVIATRTGAAPTLLERGRAGLLVAPGDPAPLERALQRLWDDAALRRRLGAAARRAARRHGWDARARLYEKALREAARG